MDTLAHGLWGGAVFGQKSRTLWTWAFFWGMAPDLFSFGPFFLVHLPLIIRRWGGHHRWEPPDPRVIPAYVYHAYNVTHSLVVWVLAFVAICLVSMYRRAGVLAAQNADGVSPARPLFDAAFLTVWPFGAWGLHILCDIPTHTTRFFPTPFLWPFHTPFVNGIRWASPSFMIANYALLTMTYLSIRAYKRYLLKSG